MRHDSGTRRDADRRTALLDELDPARHDALDILDRLNALVDLDDETAEEERFAITECAHPLGVLCGEAHNDSIVIRDIDGELALIVDTDPRVGHYVIGQFCAEHISQLELESLQDHADTVGVAGDRLKELIELLPAALGPVRSF